MRKYVIFIGDNLELSEKVQKSLIRAGFSWPCGESTTISTAQILILNHWEPGEILYASGLLDTSSHVTDATILQPHDIIEDVFALELDGAKKLWEIPPEGCRIVSLEEREKSLYPDGKVFYAYTNNILPFRSGDPGGWRRSFDSEGWNIPTSGCLSPDDVAFAVPESTPLQRAPTAVKHWGHYGQERDFFMCPLFCKGCPMVRCLSRLAVG